MKIGVFKEIKADEFRVSLTPKGAEELTRGGHHIWVEKDAGTGAGFSDADYEKAGAITGSKPQVSEQAELILKVKEPLPEEFDYFRPSQALFTFLHLAANPKVAQFLRRKKLTAIAYESVAENGVFPILKPMSEIAGRLSVQEGAKYLEKPFGGKGVLLAGATGTAPGNVLVLGAGVVGSNACQIAVGLGASVTVADISAEKLATLQRQFPNIKTVTSTPENLVKIYPEIDLLIGAVLLPNKATPRLVLRSDLQKMRPGTVLVDVAIDQGGCFETSRPTTHRDPVYIVDKILHYAVANMPGAVPVTATHALCQATLPYIHTLANSGLTALEANAGLKSGVNTIAGNFVHPVLRQMFQ